MVNGVKTNCYFCNQENALANIAYFKMIMRFFTPCRLSWHFRLHWYCLCLGLTQPLAGVVWEMHGSLLDSAAQWHFSRKIQRDVDLVRPKQSQCKTNTLHWVIKANPYSNIVPFKLNIYRTNSLLTADTPPLKSARWLQRLLLECHTAHIFASVFLLIHAHVQSTRPGQDDTELRAVFS